MTKPLKETIFLPYSSFPMKAGLPKKEPELLKYWQEENLYQKLRKNSKEREKFILHMGPPYANGHLHIGHALTTILKDVVTRLYQMSGKDAPLVPGWDCHGLPIEWKVEELYRKQNKKKEEVSLIEFRNECRQFAQKWIETQRAEFKRLGILADWENPYTTMSFKAEAGIVKELGKFLMDGSLYKGIKPVLWSVVEKTALAEAEVEYHDKVSPSIYVSFPVKSAKNPLVKGANIVIWTTTPWTLPGNRAIAYGKDIPYALLEITEETDTLQKGERLLIAEDLLETFTKKCNLSEKYTLLETFRGIDLEGTVCHHPLSNQGYAFDVPLLDGPHVTTEQGTGFVHTAPGHGLEDFALGKQFNLEVPQTVAEDGHYYKHVPCFGGLHIFKAADDILALLKKERRLLQEEQITHSYPHSWRSKAPLIYRVTPQWFLSMDHTHLREKALSAIEEVNWIPEQGKNRIKSMIENRPDWCLSRQRAWGTPLTLFVHKETGEVLRDQKVFNRIIEAIEKEGGDAWFTSNPARFLSPDYDREDFEQVKDILDVWFDSGATYSFVLEERPELQFPADLYLEGSDQHRGWFQSSLLESCGTKGVPPFKAVLTHGFLLDSRGYKMSKSEGNVLSLEEAIESHGADILRLWVVGSDYCEDLKIGPEIIKRQEDIYRRLRNTLRYLLGSLNGFEEGEKISYQEMSELERWVLHRLFELDQEIKEAIKKYDLHALFLTLHHFCANDLSAFYFDIRKDTLYCDSPKSLNRRGLRTVLDILFQTLSKWLAPVICFTAEEAWQTRYGTTKGSVHEHLFENIPAEWHDPFLGEKWQKIRTTRRLITGALEEARNNGLIGSSLQASLTIHALPTLDNPANLLSTVDIAEIALTSQAHYMEGHISPTDYVLPDFPGAGIEVSLAQGDKCQRCWKVLEEVKEEGLCLRCKQVIGEN